MPPARGLSHTPELSKLRVAGMGMTFGVIGTAAVACLILTVADGLGS